MAKLKVAADGRGRGEEFRGKNIAPVLQGSRGVKEEERACRVCAFFGGGHVRFFS